jgi:two-component system LytT family response regulator
MLQFTSTYTNEVNGSFSASTALLSNKLRIATTGQVNYIDIKEIIRIQSLSNYSKIFFTNGQTILVAKVLSHFDAILSDFHFIRIHRTHLVNLNCINKFEHGPIATIGLNNDEVLPVSRSRKKFLQRELKMNCC